MDETGQLHDLLTRAADLAGNEFTAAPTAAQFTARRRARRRTAFSVGAAVTTVLALVAALSIVSANHGQPSPPAATQGSGPSAIELAQGHWTTLPPSPIPTRDGAASAWTGSQLLIWGGADQSKNLVLHNTGAAYDPVHRSWSLLPSSPLSPRLDSVSVWTGHDLFIWGGITSGPDNRSNDGALYDPANRTWRALPAVDAIDSEQTQALWTGHEVVLLTTPGGTSASADVVHAHAYDPGTNRWRSLPDLHMPTHEEVGRLTSLAAGSTIYLWVGWAHVVVTGPGSTRSNFGVAAFTLDPAATRWAQAAAAGSGIPVSPAWTGQDIVIPTYQIWCGGCSHPVSLTAPPGTMINVRTGSRRTIPAGPLGVLVPSYLWAGRALLAFDTTGQVGSHSAPPGSAAAWDSATGRWTRLPRAPYVKDNEPIAVWTGTHLLLWGSFFTDNQIGKDGATWHTVGLQFGP